MDVVHLFPREPKFFAGAQLYFDVPNCVQTWLIRCPEDSLIEFPAVSHQHTVALFNPSEPFPSSTRVVIIHYLDHEMAKLILELPSSIQIFIQTWGGDLEPLYPSHKLYQPMTFRWIYDNSKARHIPIQLGKILFDLNRQWKHRSWINAIRQSINKATLVSTGMGNNESEILNLDANLIDGCINYYVTNDSYKVLPGNPHSILLGNSSNPSNNHLDALHLLKRSSLDIEEILIPLSYGDENYRDWLIPKATQIFGNLVSPITEFKSAKDYFNLISNCGIVFMNHYRQQALGSIQWAFQSRKQVVLHENSIGMAFFASDPRIVHSARNIEQCVTSPVLYDQRVLSIIENKLKNHNRATLTKGSDLYQLITSP